MSQPAWDGAEGTRHEGAPSAARPVATWPQQLSHDSTLRVGDVLAALRHEFPSLSPSKLRFLDSQGLVTPSRTGSGYRQYSVSDVERLRFVLRQQRDLYAPLHVISARLADLDAGRAYERVAPTVVGAAGSDDASVEDAARAAGVSPALVAQLIDDGLVPSPSPGLVPLAAVPLIEAAGRYLESGADERELRSLVRSAEREVGAAVTAAVPLRRRDDDVEAAAAVVARAEAAASTYAAATRLFAAAPW